MTGKVSELAERDLRMSKYAALASRGTGRLAALLSKYREVGEGGGSEGANSSSPSSSPPSSPQASSPSSRFPSIFGKGLQQPSSFVRRKAVEAVVRALREDEEEERERNEEKEKEKK